MSGREDRKWDLVVAGGGAAGFFAALHAKAHMPEARVLLLEKSKEWLAKVAISGGGRCNVTHHCFDPSELIRFYPRGGRELRGAFHRWQPTHTVDWFESRGVKLKTEPDGRMFPVSDDAGEIIRCLTREADRAGIDRWNLCGLQGATRTDTGFEIALTNNPPVSARCLLIATGGNRGSGGLEVAKELGHAIEEPVPSLFTFHVKHPLLEGLSGIVADPVELRIPSLDATERGPMLITHWGLSGPAVLKLSAWQARALAAADYRAELTVNWLGDRNEAALRGDFERLRAQNGGQAIAKHPLGGLPRRLWERLVQTAGIPAQTPWTRLAAPQRDELVRWLLASPLRMNGKTMNKEEFVTCGGVRLDEVDMKTFQSRLVPGLFFAGEVLDIDGVTGGFNFQAAWTGGALAGQAAAALISGDGAGTEDAP